MDAAKKHRENFEFLTLLVVSTCSITGKLHAQLAATDGGLMQFNLATGKSLAAWMQQKSKERILSFSKFSYDKKLQGCNFLSIISKETKACSA